MQDSGDHLNRLSGKDLTERVRIYGNEGEFDAAIRWFWGELGDLVEATLTEHYGEEKARQNREFMTSALDESWVLKIAERGVALFKAKASIPEFIVARALVTKDSYPYPATPIEHEAFRAVVAEEVRQPAPPPGPLPLEAIDEVLLMMAWFRAHPEALRRTTPFEQWM